MSLAGWLFRLAYNLGVVLDDQSSLVLGSSFADVRGRAVVLACSSMNSSFAPSCGHRSAQDRRSTPRRHGPACGITSNPISARACSRSNGTALAARSSVLATESDR